MWSINLFSLQAPHPERSVSETGSTLLIPAVEPSTRLPATNKQIIDQEL